MSPPGDHWKQDMVDETWGNSRTDQVSAGVPHDTLTERQLADIKWWVDGDPTAMGPQQAHEYLTALLAELARVSRERDGLRWLLDNLATMAEDENPHLALSVLQAARAELKDVPPFHLAGSRAATPEDA